MPDVQIHETPNGAPASGASDRTSSGQQAKGVRFVTDTRGRSIGWKKLSYWDQMQLAELAGPTTSQNQAWMLPAMVAYAVTEIDGERVAKPGNKVGLQFLINRLGEEGMDALIADIMPPGEGDAPQLTTEGFDPAAAGN
jgi:hypothetical protein